MRFWQLPPKLPSGGPSWREAALLGFLIAVAFVACYQPIWDPDTFWHLAIGREIWETHRLVRTEVFSFTANGTPWEDTEWLSHLLMYPIWKWGGEHAVALLGSLVGAAAVALIYRCTRLCEGGAVTLAPYLLLLMECFRDRMRFRPELASFLLMPILLEGLLRWCPRPPHVGRLWLFLGALFLLWAQLHAGWAYGLVFVGAFLAGEALDALRTRSLSLIYIGRLLLTGLVPAAAIFVNPYGWRVPWFPLKSVKGFADSAAVEVMEWQRTPFSGYQAVFITVTVLLFAGYLWEWKRSRWTEVLWYVSQAFLGFLWVRYVSFAVVMLAPLAARPLNRLMKRPLLSQVLWGLSLSGCIFGVVYYYVHLTKEWDLSPLFPVQEVAFLKEHGVKGNMLNQYSVGGYLDLYGYPDLKVYMDGRYYPFLRQIDDYWKAHKSSSNFEAFLEHRPFDILLYGYPDFFLKDRGEPGRKVLRGPSSILIPREKYALVYFGNFGMVFIKRGGAFDSLISSFEYKVLRPDDLRYLTGAAVQGRVDADLLKKEILRKLEEDPLTKRSPSLERTLAALGAGDHAKKP